MQEESVTVAAGQAAGAVGVEVADDDAARLAHEADVAPAGDGPAEPAEDLGSAGPEDETAGWRERAELAEEQLGALSEQMARVERLSEELRRSIEAHQLGRTVDAALLRRGSSDLEAARRAVLAALESGDSSEIEAEVERLRVERPGLFAGGSTVGGVLRSRASGARRERAASEARTTGDRRQLLEYLRLRRSGG